MLSMQKIKFLSDILTQVKILIQFFGVIVEFWTLLLIWLISILFSSIKSKFLTAYSFKILQIDLSYFINQILYYSGAVNIAFLAELF